MRRVISIFPLRQQRGVTLIEMIVVIVVTGIILSLVGMFTRNQITSYLDVAARSELADAGDTALRRIARDLQLALPNSVRVDATNSFLEFVPIKDAGRYRAQAGGGAGDDPLNFGSVAATETFDVFGPLVNVAAGDQLVIYNLGIAGSDVYAGTSRRAIVAPFGAAVNNVSFTVGAAQLASPQNRFQVVSTPVTYVCDLANFTLWRYSGYAIQAVQPPTRATLEGLAGVIRARLATNVNCNFTYSAGVLQRNGLVSVRLTLTHPANSESVTLYHQVDVANTP